MSLIPSKSLCIDLICQHLTLLGLDFSIPNLTDNWDIELSDSRRKIKIFPWKGFNHSPRIQKNFNILDDVLYLIVSPTRKNIIGYTAKGDFGKSFQKSITPGEKLKTVNMIDHQKLKHVNIQKRLST